MQPYARRWIDAGSNDGNVAVIIKLCGWGWPRERWGTFGTWRLSWLICWFIAWVLIACRRILRYLGLLWYRHPRTMPRRLLICNCGVCTLVKAHFIFQKVLFQITWWWNLALSPMQCSVTGSRSDSPSLPIIEHSFSIGLFCCKGFFSVFGLFHHLNS